MKTTALLVRHGQTDWNASGRWQGHADIPLNENGRIQANRLARRLSSWPVKAIYSSDLKRAAETARIMAGVLSLSIVTTPAFRERNAGQFEGYSLRELSGLFPETWLEIRDLGAAPPGGESSLDVARRVTQAFEEIARRHEGESFCVVSHGGSLNLLIAYLLGFPLGTPARVSLRGNTGISVVEIDENGPRLVLLNDTHHLENGHYA